MITPPPQYLYRDVQIHPPEADRLADKLLEKIRFLTAEKEKVESSSRFLDFNWEGRKKEGFMHETNPHGKKIIDQIESYRAQERLFRSIKVNRREQYLNPEWESYQRGNR